MRLLLVGLFFGLLGSMLLLMFVDVTTLSWVDCFQFFFVNGARSLIQFVIGSYCSVGSVGSVAVESFRHLVKHKQEYIYKYRL